MLWCNGGWCEKLAWVGGGNCWWQERKPGGGLDLARGGIKDNLEDPKGLMDCPRQTRKGTEKEVKRQAFCFLFGLEGESYRSTSKKGSSTHKPSSFEACRAVHPGFSQTCSCTSQQSSSSTPSAAAICHCRTVHSR